MLQGEHSAILSTFIKVSFVIKIFVLSTFEWSLKTDFTVYPNLFGNEVGYKGTVLYVILYFHPYERYSPIFIRWKSPFPILGIPDIFFISVTF